MLINRIEFAIYSSNGPYCMSVFSAMNAMR
jgi:hypothetical protein